MLAKEFHIQPSELELMPAWEYELFMKEINSLVKEENDRNKDELSKSGIDQARNMNNPQNIAKMQKQYMGNGNIPKMPAMPKMPKY